MLAVSRRVAKRIKQAKITIRKRLLRKMFELAQNGACGVSPVELSLEVLGRSLHLDVFLNDDMELVYDGGMRGFPEVEGSVEVLLIDFADQLYVAAAEQVDVTLGNAQVYRHEAFPDHFLLATPAEMEAPWA